MKSSDETNFIWLEQLLISHEAEDCPENCFFCEQDAIAMTEAPSFEYIKDTRDQHEKHKQMEGYPRRYTNCAYCEVDSTLLDMLEGEEYQ